MIFFWCLPDPIYASYIPALVEIVQHPQGWGQLVQGVNACPGPGPQAVPGWARLPGPVVWFGHGAAVEWPEDRDPYDPLATRGVCFCPPPGVLAGDRTAGAEIQTRTPEGLGDPGLINHELGHALFGLTHDYDNSGVMGGRIGLDPDGWAMWPSTAELADARTALARRGA